MKRLTLALAVLALLFGNAGKVTAGPIKVLFLGYDNGVANVFSDILGSDPRFDLANSSYIQDQTADFVPSLSTLEQYNAVLVWSNDIPAAGLGDVLAGYVDAGGGVAATFNGYFASSGNFGGRIETPGYDPLTGGTNDAYESVSLGTYDHSSPLFAGVSSLAATEFDGDYTGVDPGATMVASWDNGRPLAALNSTGKVANITLFPNVVQYQNATGDYQQLFRNALVETAEGDQGSPVPEPATLTMLGFGVVSLVGYGWRRRKTAAVAG